MVQIAVNSSDVLRVRVRFPQGEMQSALSQSDRSAQGLQRSEAGVQRCSFRLTVKIKSQCRQVTVKQSSSSSETSLTEAKAESVSAELLVELTTAVAGTKSRQPEQHQIVMSSV